MAADRQQKRTAIFIPILSRHRSAPSDTGNPPTHTTKTPKRDNLIRRILKNVIEVEETSRGVNVSQPRADREERPNVNKYYQRLGGREEEDGGSRAPIRAN